MTRDIRLRDVEAADLPVLYEHQRDPDAIRMAAFPSRDWTAFAAHWAAILADDTVAKQTIVVDGQVAGHIGSFGPVDAREVGYWIGRAFWGQGVATAALAAFLRQVPERPLFAHVTTDNVGSLRVLERCGFTQVGERRATAATGGAVDEVILRLG